MDKVAVALCRWCERTIYAGEGYWVHHPRDWPAPAFGCEECVIPVAAIVHPDAPLLPPAGWGPTPNASRPAAQPSEVKPE